MTSTNDKLAKIAINKSLLKEYSNSSNERIVYMNDDTEFQIQIFNPYSYVIGVSISFNENQQSTSNLLVLKPGERVWLDRYLDNESKLLFSTYKVNNSKAVQNAIQNNGKLTIKFFKERTNNDYSIYVSNINVASTQANPAWYDTTWYENSNALTTGTIDMGTTTTATSSDISYSTASTVTCYNNYLSTSSSESNKIETGRIEKGSHSNQKFTNTYKDFEYWPFATEIIKIMPSSTKPINSSDLQKRYCSNCGRKLNQKFKFCPYCGAKV
jgi:hypothetical protein